MSLINKMLRDLDARHASAGPTALPNEVRPLPEPTAPRRVGRGVWILAGLTLVSVAALQTTAWWLPALVESNLLPANLIPQGFLPMPAPVAPVTPAPVPATPAPTIVLQMPPPEQMLSLPALPAETPAPKAGAPSPAAPPAPAGAQPPADSRGTGPNVQTQHTAQAVAAPPKPPVAETTSARNGAAAVKIDKRQTLASPQDRAETEYRKSIAAYRQGHASEAIVLLRVALHEDPRHLTARQMLLSLLAEQKQWDDVQGLLREGLDLMPAQFAWAMALARIQVEAGNAQGAWETMQQYMAYGEKSADYHGFSGVLLQRLQKPREAAMHYQAAVQINPNEGRWWLGLGLAYEADGRPAEARDAFQHARSAAGLTPQMAAVIDKKLR